MSKDKYNIDIEKNREDYITVFTAILVFVSTVYSLYSSQHADFFIVNMIGDISFVNTDAGKKVYGFVLIVSAFKLLMMLGMLNTKQTIKKFAYALSCLMIGNMLGFLSFGQSCPEMVNLSAYACQTTQLIERYSNMIIIGLLTYICYLQYRKSLNSEKENIKEILNVKSS